mgnify:CR=1 FL=1
MKSPYLAKFQKKTTFLSISAPKPLTLIIQAICLSLFIYSCDNEVLDSDLYNETLNIDPTLASNYDINEVFNEFDFLSLENGGQLVGSVDKVIFAENKYYILDKDYTNGVYIFDVKGGYIGQIGIEGDGPTNYEDINDFTIVTVEGAQEVWILDNGNGYLSLCKYDLAGAFLKKTKSKLMADFIDYVPSGSLIFSTSNQCNDDFCADIFTTDLNLKVVAKANKPTALYREFWFEPNNPISVSQTTASAISYGHSKIIRTDTQTGLLINDIKVDFGTYGISSDITKKYYASIEGFLVETNRERVCHLIDNLFHTDRNLFFSFKYGSSEYYYLKNSTYQNGTVIKNILLNTGIDVILPLDVIGGYDNTLLVLLGTEELLAFYQKHKDEIDKHSGPFPSLLRDIKDSSNPVIVKLKFR